jgi:hypothetical protein
MVLSRRKKNPSTISRSRSLASTAERRALLGVGGNPSKVARSPEACGEVPRAIAMRRDKAGTHAQPIGDLG